MKQFIFLCVLCILAAGCNRGVSVYSVSGEVVYDGKPVSNALVSFVAEAPDGRGASAITAEDGTFTVLTQGAAESGAMTGTYRVLVSKWIEIDERGNEVKRQAAAEYRPDAPQEKQYPQKNLLPPKYEKKETSDLTVTVEPKKNHFTLELR